MKNFLTIMLIAFTLLSCQEESLLVSQESPNVESLLNGEVFDKQNGQVIEVTSDYLKKKWENEMLVNEDINIKLDKFILIKIENSDDKAIQYFLKAISTAGKVETGAFLKRGGDGTLYLESKTCTCKGCADGCSLTVNGDTCSCSPCIWGGGDCVKTETVVIEK